MTRAYDEIYLDDAMDNLGEMTDYAVNHCHIDIDEFFGMFLVSGLAEQFGKGVPKYIAGMSGTELALEVLYRSRFFLNALAEPSVDYVCSPEYWSGWILAYYQWYTGQSFRDILENLTMKDILKLYPTLHEASEQKFVDVAKRIIEQKKLPCKLQTRRKNCGYSQRELAEKSGVSLRTLQQYEIRAKDINKAAAGSLDALAKVLGCRIEDLLE